MPAIHKSASSSHDRVLLLLTSLLLLAVGSLGAADAGARPWEKIDDDEGIVVLRREIPGQELPGFRGETTMRAPIPRIIEVLEDHAHHREWMHRCAAAQKLRDLGNGGSIVYNRTDAPWPVWDRDVILEAHWSTSADGKVSTLRFKNTNPKLKAVPDGTVRMPKLEGFYELRQLAPDRTYVVYQVEADPGGSLPTWLAKRVVRDLPYNTLHALRARVER